MDDTNAGVGGQPVREATVLLRQRRSWGGRALRLGVVLLTAAGVVVLSTAALVAWTVRDAPFSRIEARNPDPVVQLTASDDSVIAWDGPKRGVPVKIEDVPQHLIDAVLAIEDRRFYSHYGIDPVGILRAAFRNAQEGRIVEGGSTITQQYVRGRFLHPERSFQRKTSEAALAVWLEMRSDKKSILEGYLNNAYFGSGAYGIAAAADTYFGKPVADLTVEESALLAGLVRAPTDLNPLTNRAQAEKRARTVLRAMVDAGSLSEDEAMVAATGLSELQLVEKHVRGSWFGDWLRADAMALADRFAPGQARTVTMRTTLDPSIQAIAERAVAEALKTDGPASKVTQGALVAMRPDGAVVAMVGGADYEASHFNRATQAKRQPGSLFKLFVYYAALRNGYRIDQRIDDAPIEVNGWKPQNFDGEFAGRISLAEAFWRSRNLPAVRLALDTGLDEVARAARDLGLDAPVKKVPSLALGASEATLLDLTGAFASIRAGKAPIQPWAISAIETDGDGQHLRPARSRAQAGDLAVLRPQLMELLTGVVERGTGRGAAIPGAMVAGKTGTSEDFRDAWFIGFTDELVVGVWVGNDNGAAMDGVTGGRLPARIWRQFVTEATPVIGNSVDDLVVADSGAQSSALETASAACDIDACAQKYRSFDPSDCTFQPYFGDRRLCPFEGTGEQTVEVTVIAPDREVQTFEVAPERVPDARITELATQARIRQAKANELAAEAARNRQIRTYDVAPRITFYQPETYAAPQRYQRVFQAFAPPPPARVPVQPKVWEGGR